MAEYMIKEANFSDEEENVIVIDEETHEGREFIDDEVKHDDEGVEFYRSVSKIFLNDEGTPVPTIKEDIVRLRIESDSESKHEEEPQILNHKLQKDDIVMPEAKRLVYGMDNYEWNHYNRPKGEVCNFSKDINFLESFKYTLLTPTKNNEKLNSFLPMAQNYEPGLQPIDGLYQTLLYGLRHAKTGEHLHTFAFSCIDNDLLNELEKFFKKVPSKVSSIL